jgi:Tfp pilus assembly protein PilF
MRRALIAVALCIAACRATPTGPYSPPSEGQRNTTRAEQRNREAADLLASDPARAEALLREALTADLFFGPAHNNLGVVYLGQGKLYEAANEFEWARKLLPGHPDPRVNLGLCLEQAGKVDDALKAYEAALEVWPDYLPAVQGLALATVRAGREDERLAAWLDAIAQRSDDEPWREWALDRVAAKR